MHVWTSILALAVVKWSSRHLFAMCLCALEITKRPFDTEMCPSVIKILLKEASKSSSNSNLLMCPKQPFKREKISKTV